jgi:hypothetical protein
VEVGGAAKSHPERAARLLVLWLDTAFKRSIAIYVGKKERFRKVDLRGKLAPFAASID